MVFSLVDQSRLAFPMVPDDVSVDVVGIDGGEAAERAAAGSGVHVVGPDVLALVARRFAAQLTRG